jgi:hypothetical protein
LDLIDAVRRHDLAARLPRKQREGVTGSEEHIVRSRAERHRGVFPRRQRKFGPNHLELDRGTEIEMGHTLRRNRLAEVSIHLFAGLQQATPVLEEVFEVATDSKALSAESCYINTDVHASGWS